DAAVADGFAAGNDGELREAVEHVRGFGIEVIGGVVIANLRGGSEAQVPGRAAGFRIVEGVGAVASEPEGIAKFREVAPNGAKNADAGDNGAAHQAALVPQGSPRPASACL